MSAAEKKTKLMDRKALRDEYGFSERALDRILGDLDSVQLPGMPRKMWVYRADVERYLDAATTSKERNGRGRHGCASPQP